VSVPTRIFKTAEFIKFSAKERIADEALVDTIARVEHGLVDADLGGGVLKLRIARPNEGRRGGYRTIVACVVERRAFFLFGFGKNDRANVEPGEVRAFKRLAEILQSMDESTLKDAVEGGEIVEVAR
jgi:hypothetical protein